MINAVDVDKLTGWIDYDRSSLPQLMRAQRVDYFEKRVRLVVLNPLGRILHNEIFVAGGKTSALLIYAVSLCCAIEAAGRFLTNANESNKRFHEFLNTYMSPDFQTGKIGMLTYGEALWKHFRNGLAHGFAVKHGGFEGNPNEPYFSERDFNGYLVLEINPTRLLEDFSNGIELYIKDVRSARPSDRVYKTFHAVFERVFILGD